MASDPADWSASEIEARVLRREIRAEAVARALLTRIRASEGEVGAFEAIDPAYVLAQARALDRTRLRGALHGVPIAISDTIETRDYPTAWGTPIYRGLRSHRDAGVVALARHAGAVILGKTVVTELATAAPGKTRNPYDLGHTPGGSASGAAAAVAERLVPLAFAIQAGASIIRPASFCGVIGYKASWGEVDLGGAMSLSRWLDSFGLFCRQLSDISLVRGVLSGSAAIRRPTMPLKPPRIALYPSPDWERASPDMQAMVRETARQLADAGAEVIQLTPPESFAQLSDAHRDILSRDTTLARIGEWDRGRERLSGPLLGALTRGLRISPQRYRQALAMAESARAAVDKVMASVDVILTPAATGEAPAGLVGSGDPVFGRIWTLLHLPAIALPVRLGPGGLPMAVQLVGARGRDDKLVADALWIERTLFPELPPEPEAPDAPQWEMWRE